jgi:hypothetical protein
LAYAQYHNVQTRRQLERIWHPAHCSCRHGVYINDHTQPDLN